MSQLQAPAQSQQYSQSTGGGQQGQMRQQQQSAAGQASQTRQGGQQSAVMGPVGQRFQTRSYLPENTRTTSISLLNQCLADLTAVNMQLKQAHWNVKGIHFYQLHELFEDLTEAFEEHIDTVAERASALGGQAFGTASDVVQNCTVPPLSRAVDGQTLLAEIADRLAQLDANIGQQIEVATQCDDPDTADLLNEVSRDVSKALWFVEAHLQGPGAGAHAGGGGTTAATGGEMTGFQQADFGRQQESPDSQWETSGLQ